MISLNARKMCYFFERGKCASATCRYAHSSSELRSAPDLQKTPGAHMTMICFIRAAR